MKTEMRRRVTKVTVAVLAVAAVAVIAFRLGWSHGAFMATAMHSLPALKAAEEVCDPARTNAVKAVKLLVATIEADVLAFDDRWTTLQCKEIKDDVVLRIDRFRQSHGNIGHDDMLYDRVFSNAVKKAREGRR